MRYRYFRHYGKSCALLLIIIAVKLVFLTFDPVTRPLTPDRSEPLPNADLCSSLLKMSDTWKIMHFVEAGQVPGHRPQRTKFLSIGIASVYRREGYLKRTLEALVTQSQWPEERQLATIVLFLADTDHAPRALQRKMVEDNFQEYLDTGFIQLIDASPAIYPALEGSLRRTLGESLERVQGRTKEAIDLAFVLSYVSQHALSEYHMVIDDDSVASSHYLTAIKDFIGLKEQDGSAWGALHFSSSMAMGLTFRAGDTWKMAQFLLMFHQQQPCDALLNKFLETEYSMLPNAGVLRRIPSSFQHIGTVSTLKNKTQNLLDNTFGEGRRRFEHHKNPELLRMSSTLKTEGDFVLENAYSAAPGWFQGCSSGGNETIDLVYDAAIPIKRILVISGSSNEGSYQVKEGSLLIGSQLEGGPLSGSASCAALDIVGHFENGVADFRLKDGTSVQCIQIQMSTPKNASVIVREIQVF